MPSSELELEPTADSVAVTLGGEAFTTVRPGPGTKPILYPLLAPGGIPVTRGFPMEKRAGEAEDHPHHVSLWFAHGDVDGHDFWHGDAEGAFVRTTSLRAEGAQVASTHEWVANGEVLAEERRSLGFGSTSSTRWIDFDIAVDPRADSITFGDTKEGTFALRLAAPLRAEGEVATGRLLDSEGRVDGSVWGKRARWVAAQGSAGGREVTVAVFDHPKNPRHPTWWHARQYGLLAANPFGRRAFEGEEAPTGALSVKGEVRLRYRVWIASGLASSSELDAAWSAYAEP